MQLTELFFDRFLYKAKQTIETLGADATAVNNAPAPSNAVASGNTVIDVNTNSMQLNGAVIAPQTLDIAGWGWTQTCVFTVISANRVDWSSGVFTSANGLIYNISAGSITGMSAKNYVYLDTNVSQTIYQATTSVTAPVGIGKVLIAVCENGTTSASYMLVQATQVVADNILVNSLSAISANMGSINAGTITGALIQTASSAPRIEMSGSANAFRAYDSGNNLVAKLGTSNRALDIATSSDTNNGIYVTDTTGGVGYYYENTSNVSAKGIYLHQSSTGANNNLPSIEIVRAGTGSSIFVTDTGFSTSTVYLSRAKTGNTIEIAHTVPNGSARAVGIEITMGSGGANIGSAFSFDGEEYVSSAVGGTQDRKIRVLIGGTTYYIPAYTA